MAIVAGLFFSNSAQLYGSTETKTFEGSITTHHPSHPECQISQDSMQDRLHPSPNYGEGGQLHDATQAELISDLEEGEG